MRIVNNSDENDKSVEERVREARERAKKMSEDLENNTGGYDVDDGAQEEEERKMVIKSTGKPKYNFVEDDKYGYNEKLFESMPTPYSESLKAANKDENNDSYVEKDLSDEDYLATVQGRVDYEVEKLVQHFTQRDPIKLNSLERGKITKEEFLKDVIERIKSERLGKELSLRVLDGFKKYMWSYGRLDVLINDESISDVKCVAYNRVRIKRNGRRETSNVRFKDKEAYRRFVDRVAILNKVSISDQNAVTNFTDKDSNDKFIMRFNISTPFVNSIDTPYLHIRKIAKKKVTIPTLIDRKMMTPAIARYLRRQAAKSEGIIFTGKGASGKTTAMNALIDLIPSTYSGLVIQENEELFSELHPDFMFQHTVINRGEGKIEYTLQDLARNGLLLDLDYFLIGEIKGAEALYMLNASYTGHRCWCSVHGASANEAIYKLVDYIKYASDYSREDALHMLTHLRTIVFMKSYKVWEISEIVGWDDDKHDLIYKPIVREGKPLVHIGPQGEVLD